MKSPKKHKPELWLNLALVFFAIGFILPMFSTMTANIKVDYKSYPEYVPTSEEIEGIARLQTGQIPVYEIWPEVKTVAYRNGEWTKVILSKDIYSRNSILTFLIIACYALTLIFIVMFILARFITPFGCGKDKHSRYND